MASAKKPKKLLNGEVLAREMAELKRAPATEQELERYLNLKSKLEAQRDKRHGLIGISRIQGVSHAWYQVRIPSSELRQVKFRNPIQAVSFYNWFARCKYGEHAVLCEVSAVIRQWFPEFQKQERGEN